MPEFLSNKKIMFWYSRKWVKLGLVLNEVVSKLNSNNTSLESGFTFLMEASAWSKSHNLLSWLGQTREGSMAQAGPYSIHFFIFKISAIDRVRLLFFVVNKNGGVIPRFYQCASPCP
jgi:hypothetical protein